MAERSYPWTGRTIGDAGPYTSADWHTLYARGVARHGDDANSGVLLGTGSTPVQPLFVSPNSPADMSVLVAPGAAIVQGIYYESTAQEQVTVPENSSGNGRVDTVIIRVDFVAQTVRLAYLEGTPAASPVRPVLTQDASIWEIPLADVSVPNSDTAIDETQITNYPLAANAPGEVVLDWVFNASGAELITGDVVLWETGTAQAVTTGTGSANAGKVAGVVVGLIPAGSWGRVLVHGIGLVRVNAAVTIGKALSLSSTAKQAAISQAGPFAITLESRSAAGLALCYVDAGHAVRAPQLHCDVSRDASQVISTGTETTVAWNTETYKTVASMHDNATNNSRITCPRAGIYLLNAYINMGGAGGTFRAARIYKNGATLVVDDRRGMNGQINNNPSAITLAAAGDYFEIKVEHDQGININLAASSHFAVSWLGEVVWS